MKSGSKVRAAKRAAVALSMAAIVGLTTGDLRAASATWSATPSSGLWVPLGGENNWSTGVNSFPGSVSGLSSDIATFAGSNITTIGINSGTLNIGSISFTGTPANYTIGATDGNSLFLNGGGQIAIGSAVTALSKVETINAPLVLQGTSYTFSQNSTAAGNLLNFNGSVTGGNNAATTLTLTGAGTGANTISGAISNGFSSNLGIAKTSTGNWFLTGTNSYTGGTAIGGGMLQFTNAAALPTTGMISLTTGGALSVNGPFTTVAAWLNSGRITTNSTGSLAIGAGAAAENVNFGNFNNMSLGASVAVTYTGTLTPLNNTYRLGGGSGTLTYGQVITGANALAISGGSGTVTLSGTTANTYTGPTSISGGSLLLNKTGAGVNNAVNGNILLTGGALRLNVDNQIPDNAYITVNGGTFDSNTRNETIGSLTVAGTGTYQTTGGTGILTVANTMALGSGGTLIVNSGGGTISANAFYMSGGTTTFGNSTGTNTIAVGPGGFTIGNAAAAVTTIIRNGPSTGIAGGRYVLNGDLTTVASSATSSINLENPPTQTVGGNVDLGANATRTFNVNNGSAAIDLSMTAPLTSGASTNFVKAGGGTLLLLNKNTYTGSTSVDGGVLLEDFSLALASTGANATLADNLPATALTLNSGTLQVKGRTNGAATGVTGTWTSGSTTITVPAGQTATLAPGQVVAATGLPVGTFVTSIVSNTQFTISVAATAAGTSAAVTATPNSAATSQTFNGLTLNGAGVLDVLQNGGSSTTIDLRGAGAATIARNAGGTIDFRSTGATLGSTGAVVKINDVNDANTGILGAFATVNGGVDLAINDRSGNVGTYAGYTPINATGSSIADAPFANLRTSVAGGGGNITLDAATTTINTLFQASTTAATVDTAGKTLRLGAIGGVLMTPTGGALTIGTAAGSGTLTAGGGDNSAGELILNNNSASALIVNAAIANNGSGAVTLVKAGSGLLTLATTNTYTGATHLIGGSVGIVSNGNLGAPASVLNLNGGGLQTATTFSLTDGTTSRSIVVGPSGGTFNITANTLTAPGLISGSSVGGSLIKTGAGTLSLPNVNTYAGPTVVNGGSLLVGSSTVSGNSPLGSTSGITSVLAGDVLLANGVTITGETISINGVGSTSFGPLATPISATPVVATWAGPVILNTNDARIGAELNGTLNVTGPIDDQGNTFNLVISGRSGSGTPGIIVLSGQNAYSGNTKITRGTLRLGANNTLPMGTVVDVHDNVGNSTEGATFDLNSFSQTIAGLQRTGPTTGGAVATVTNSAGGAASVLTVNGSTAHTYPGVITGNVTLVRAGSGSLTLTGTNTYTGATTVSGGSLIVGTGGSLTSATNSVTVTSNALLGGSGSIAGPITIDTAGILSPGSSPGQLTVGGLTLAASSQAGNAPSGSQTIIEITGPGAAGTTFDQIVVPSTGTGVAINGGNLQVVLGYTPTSIESYTIIDNQTGGLVTGAGFEFVSGVPIVNNSATFNGIAFNIDYAAGTGNDVVLTVIPEPTSVALLAMAGIGLLARRRRAFVRQ